MLAFLLPNLGVQELLIILVIAVLIFGGKKIPEVAKGLGQGIRQFKDSLKEAEADDSSTAKKQSAGEAKSST
ncbi:MAG: twin-arginine translocase TatA/TatE family subunit [Acidobacteria bacterium]|nr:twin-arginine translocase TatA/TatE family subunit [Acidobacteriota bacterium]